VRGSCAGLWSAVQSCLCAKRKEGHRWSLPGQNGGRGSSSWLPTTQQVLHPCVLVLPVNDDQSTEQLEQTGLKLGVTTYPKTSVARIGPLPVRARRLPAKRHSDSARWSSRARVGWTALDRHHHHDKARRPSIRQRRQAPTEAVEHTQTLHTGWCAPDSRVDAFVLLNTIFSESPRLAPWPHRTMVEDLQGAADCSKVRLCAVIAIMLSGLTPWAPGLRHALVMNKSCWCEPLGASWGSAARWHRRYPPAGYPPSLSFLLLCLPPRRATTRGRRRTKATERPPQLPPAQTRLGVNRRRRPRSSSCSRRSSRRSRPRRRQGASSSSPVCLLPCHMRSCSPSSTSTALCWTLTWVWPGRVQCTQ
jgi:hypothetical protein